MTLERLTQITSVGITSGITLNNATLTGVTTIASLDSVSVDGTITAVNGTFSGNVSIAGTLTYEDVTNIDSVGLITARSGIHVTGGSVGIGTDNPGASLQITADSPGILFQDANSGSTESKIEGLSGHLYYTTDNVNRDHIFSATGGSESFRITGDGNIGIGTDNPATEFHVQDGSDLLVALFESPNNHVRLRIKSASSSLGQLEFADADDADAGEIRYDHSTDKMTFHVGNNTERVGITSTGNVQVANGNLVFSTSGTGIDFSATSDGTGAVSEILQDYEEGEWTPEIVGSSGGTATGSTGAGSGGWYVRVGNTIWLNFYFANPSITGTMSGDLRLNLPFTQANNDRFDNGGGGSVTYTRNFSSGGSDRRITFNVDRGLSYARFKTLYDNATTETSNLTQAMASLTTNTLIKGNMIMRVD